MDDYMASIEPGGYYKVYLRNVQLNSPGLILVNRMEKLSIPRCAGITSAVGSSLHLWVT